MMTSCRHTRPTVAALLTAAAVLSFATIASASLNDGIVQFRAGHYFEAIRTLSPLTKQTPPDIAATFWLGRACLESGQLARADKALSAVVEQLPDSVEARYWLGVVLARSGRATSARLQLQAALEIDPKHAPSLAAIEALPDTSPAIAPAPVVGSERSASGGTRIRIETGGLPLDIGTVDLLSRNVLDYTFGSAPVDWFARSGVWAITNRWTCSPQWSWLGGAAENGIAALWNKREFAGDITVEAYLAFKMGLGAVHSYKNPTDLNISVHADGANPGSGYSFMVGANKNSDTRIMKGTNVLASSSDPSALLPIFEDAYPSTYDFHRKWWAVRARKRAGKLQLFVDEKLVCEADDPEPLTGGRVALWTYNKGMIISRVKIYHEWERVERSPVPGVDRLGPAHTTVAQVPFTIESKTHPSVQNDFEAGPGAWGPKDPKAPTQLHVVPSGAGGRGHCLQLTNVMSGGPFGAMIVPGEFRADELPKLSFDYRLPADGNAKVNLYLRVAGRPCEIVFSGPSRGTPRATQLGAIPNVIADGQWHRAEFDLLGALNRHESTRRTPRARQLWIGNLCEDDYLLAGFGGNYLGTTYHIDNFALDKPAGRQVELSLVPKARSGITEYSIAFDKSPTTDPPATVSHSTASARFEGPSSGEWFAHARAKLPDKTWSATSHHRVRVDDAPPTVVRVEPAAETPLPDAPVTIVLADPGGSGIDEGSLKVSLNGKTLQMDKPGAAYDPQSCELRVDPRLLVANPKDGDRVTLGLEQAADRSGNRMQTPHSWSYRIAFAQDHVPPSPPTLKIGTEGYLCNEDFEQAIGGFTTYGGSSGAELSLDDTTSASGKRSLRIFNPAEGGRFGIIRRGSFDAGKYRVVAFDYKVPARLRVDMAVYVNGDMKGIKFKDNDDSLGVIGEVPNVRDDNQWHHAEFDLYSMLRKDDPTAASYVVNQFVIADWNWKANVEGQVYHLDNFQIIPVISGSQGLPLSWVSPDISGIAGLAWAITTSGSPQVPRSIKLPGANGTIRNVSSTNGWLHGAVRDGAGNWSDVTSERLIVDSEAPAAAALFPENGIDTATSAIALRLADTGAAGIDPSSIALQVAGKEYKVKKLGVGGLSYDGESCRLDWNCERVRPTPVVIPDGTTVEVKLKSAMDYAGNKVNSLPAWTWRMDYSLDKTAPEFRELKSATHRTLLTNTFEDSLQGWKTHSGASGAKVELDASTAATGRACVKLTQQRSRGKMSAYITQQAFSAESYPVLSFDYRIPRGVKLDLIAHMAEGTEYAVALTDNPTGAIGRVPRVRADDKWRHASVDLVSLLRPKQKTGSLKVAYLYLSERNNLENSRGARAWFDNFVIGAVGTRAPVMRWAATDTTGIVGYSYVLDREPGTEPDGVSEGTERSFRKLTKLKKGRWYFHIRALDGAGNWGATRHYALMHLSAT